MTLLTLGYQMPSPHPRHPTPADILHVYCLLRLIKALKGGLL